MNINLAARLVKLANTRGSDTAYQYFYDDQQPCKTLTYAQLDERAKQISNATGVIVPMEVEWAFHCYNGFALEQECHHKLERYRVSNNREFFQMSLEEAKATVEELGERYI